MKYTVSKRHDQDGWLVTWRENGKRSRKSFTGKTDAEIWAKDMNDMAAIGASPAEIMAAKRESAGTGYSMDELVRAGLEHMRGIGAARADAKMTFAEAALKVQANAKRNGARQVTIDGYAATYAVLNKHWGNRACAFITEREVEDYLATMLGRNGAPAAPATKEDHLRHIRMAMRCAGVKEPLRNITVYVPKAEPKFFSVDECMTILANTPEEARGFVAVALFGAVRPENLELLPAEAVSAKTQRIRIPGSISKDGNTHLLQTIMPKVLWKWLEKYPYKPIQWEPLRRRLKFALGNRWIADGLRHTGATYYCAKHGIAATARYLTHAGESLVKKHYAGVIEEEVADEFYLLTPDSIEFVVRELRMRSKIMWPSDVALTSMLKERTARSVAAELGVSDSALGKHCRLRKIQKPGRGHWTAVAYKSK